MKRINERVNIRAVQIRMLVAYVLLSFFSIHTISTLIINFSSDVLANKATMCWVSDAGNYCNALESSGDDYIYNKKTLAECSQSLYKTIAEKCNE